MTIIKKEELEYIRTKQNTPPMKNNLSLTPSLSGVPHLDCRLTEEAINYLWNSINEFPKIDTKLPIGQSRFSPEITKIQDKDNWFYENVLKECAETLHYRDWQNHYNTHIAKIVPPPKFLLSMLWVNRQKQHEFTAPHIHNRGIGFSFVVFMKIPTHWKEQHSPKEMIEVLDRFGESDITHPQASDFLFLLSQGQFVKTVPIPLSPDDEGRMLFFPAWINHQVLPYYGTEEERITVSGNVEMERIKND